MKTTAAHLTLLVLAACGAPFDDDALPPIDESSCTATALEADGIDSGPLPNVGAGPFIVSTTYLRLPLSKRALARFQELNRPMEDALRANAGLVGAVTRLSGSCNTARTLGVWKDEAAMYQFVGSPAHAAAMAAVAEVSRGGSITSHWRATTPEEATWAEVTRRLATHDGPVY